MKPLAVVAYNATTFRTIFNMPVSEFEAGLAQGRPSAIWNMRSQSLPPVSLHKQQHTIHLRTTYECIYLPACSAKPVPRLDCASHRIESGACRMVGSGMCAALLPVGSRAAVDVLRGLVSPRHHATAGRPHLLQNAQVQQIVQCARLVDCLHIPIGGNADVGLGSMKIVQPFGRANTTPRRSPSELAERFESPGMYSFLGSDVEVLSIADGK